MSTFSLLVFHQNKWIHTTVDKETTLLDALRQLPYEWRYACLNGACGVCRCRLQSGVIDYRGRAATGLWDEDVEKGYILPCVAYADSDLSVAQVRVVANKK